MTINITNEIEALIRTTAAHAGGSVVSIGRNGRGTGFVIATDRVLTSAHNLRDDTVSVTFADARNEQATVHAEDADGDLVVLAVPTGDALALTFAETAPELGAAVVALARGGHRSRATLGFVSGLDRSFHGPRGRVVRGSIEHTAPLARGSSGGPVFDASGAVIGVNTHRIGDGFYLARLADEALRARVAEMLEGRSPQRRTLGVAVAPNEVARQLRQAVGLAERAGVLIRGVDDAGPAARSGLLVGDLIVRVGDHTVATVDDLQDALEALTADTVEVGVVRGTDELTIPVTFGA